MSYPDGKVLEQLNKAIPPYRHQSYPSMRYNIDPNVERIIVNSAEEDAKLDQNEWFDSPATAAEVAAAMEGEAVTDEPKPTAKAKGGKK